jgi:hypothetical protein
MSNETGEIGGGTPEDRINFLEQYGLTKNCKVFEIGSGAGIDAQVFRSQGYDIDTSDYAEGFFEMLQSKGFSPVEFDVINNIPDAQYSCIYANAVFVHISQEDMKQFLSRVYTTSYNGTIVFISVLLGDGYERSARGRGFERDFYYYNEDLIREIYKSANVSIIETKNINDKWLWVFGRVDK